MFQISPGVQVREEDLSLIIPSVPISIGAFVGEFDWGPVNQISIVDSTQDLEERFGRPTNQNAGGYFTAWNFLQYSQDLRLIRVIPDDAALSASDTIGNAVAGLSAMDDTDVTEYSLSSAGTVIIKNEDQFDALLATDFVDLNESTGGSERAFFYARYPGDRGNNLEVSAADSATFPTWAYADEFATSELATDEMAVLVRLNGVTVETFIGSANPESTDENGRANFVDFLINTTSAYVFMVPTNVYDYDGTTLTLSSLLSTAIGGGSDELVGFSQGGSVYFDGVADPSADRQAMVNNGWDEFAAAEDIDINYCMTGDYDETIASYVVDNVAEVRKDCVAFISPTYADAVTSNQKVTDIVEWRKNTLNVNSSYAVMDGNYKLQLDAFNRKYRWVPLNGDIAGLAARTANTRDPWWSPAGLERGQIKNVVRFAFIPSKADRDELYKNGINIVTAFPGEGNVLWGDKTLLARPSAFDRINVRMLFIVIEKAIAKAARNLLFEFNDEFTRNRFVQSVEPFLRDVQGRRGIIRHEGRDGFIVVADERINTPEVIDRNEFRARILIKPARSINFATLTFSATRTGVEFDELLSDLFPEDER